MENKFNLPFRGEYKTFWPRDFMKLITISGRSSVQNISSSSCELLLTWVIQTKDPYAILWKMDAPIGNYNKIGCVALSPSRSEIAVTNLVSGIDFYSLKERKHMGTTYYDFLGKSKSNRIANIAYMREDFVVAGLLRTDKVKIRSSLRLAFGVVRSEPIIFYADGEGENLYYVVLSVHFKRHLTNKDDVKEAETRHGDVPTTPPQAMVNKDPSRIVHNQQSKLSHALPNDQSAQIPTSAVQQVPPMASNQAVPMMVPDEVPPIMALNQMPSIASSQVLPTEVPLTTSNQEPLVVPNQVDDRSLMAPTEVSTSSSGHVNAASAPNQEPITLSNHSFGASTHASANSSDQVRFNVSDVSLNVSDQVLRNASDQVLRNASVPPIANASIPPNAFIPPNASVTPNVSVIPNASASATTTLPPTTASTNMSDLKVTQAPSVTSNQVSSSTSTTDKEDSSPTARSGQLNSENDLLSSENDSHHGQHFSTARRVSRALKAILSAALVAWIIAAGYPYISSKSLSNLKQALDPFLPLLSQPTAVAYDSETAQFLKPKVALATQPTVIAHDHDPEKVGLLEPTTRLTPERYMEEFQLRAAGITQATACTHVPSPTESPAVSIVVCTVTETVTVTAIQSVTITTDLNRPTVLPGPAPPPKLTSPETANSGSSTNYMFYCSILLCLFSLRLQILRFLPHINKFYHLLRYAYRLLHYVFCLFAELTRPAEYNETSPEKALKSDVMIVEPEGDLELEGDLEQKADEELDLVNIKSEDVDSKY
ncbi:uncharacterized protein LACBIDRAFT_334835 [Laccaria bicolor S238N-H82]|uniref:Predicted protein n=1 Tax=Laccaria bicolor (strain S238N-H82 / ATCC MYA-4686) TaxID=486041 RepID=B0E0H8_LACBS|nr:uncharacterized protein LACBIDRAFT_334835 [Laccaria bicolor S238N-H82]EDQ99720.1 predicted protein [Laccaria bicolor S238N-H82]|eukprot:XP_001889697.1 predicted protein [Laccaria bicolor S238N-H82]